MNIAVIGNGCMGRAIGEACAQDREFRIAGYVGPGAFARLCEIPDCAAAIDFSYPGGLDATLEDALAREWPLVIGTTGLSPAQEAAIRAAGTRIPIVRSGNFSTGVTVLLRLARQAAQALTGWDIEITETHHRHKADAPSGTAKMLLAAVDPAGDCAAAHGREGIGRRAKAEIGMHALRGGTVCGVHSVHFFGEMEALTIEHRAQDRAIFARGALRAARFAAGAQPGVYDMEDVLFGQMEC